MEEHVGLLWDRLITRAATRRYPAAAVTLQQVGKTVAILFRALGGDGGLRVEAATATAHGARRSWLQRLAGSNVDVEFAAKHPRGVEGSAAAAELDAILAGSLANRSDFVPANACRECGKQEGLMSCSRCKRVKYCGAACQKADWVRRHKRECAKK